MKTLNDYIIETATPDKFIWDNKLYNWKSKNAVTFITNTETDTTLLGKPNMAHSLMIDALRYDNPTKFQYRFINDDVAEDFLGIWDEEWDDLRPSPDTKENPKTKYILGRFWHFDKSPDNENHRFIVIALWQALDSKPMHDTILSVVQTYLDTTDDKDINNVDIYAVDNNGELYSFDKNKATEITDRTKDAEEMLKVAKSIHLATQKEKNAFYSEFKKNRDEKNQKIYNHTKSKTEAEWRSLRYQENKLNNNTMKSILNYINESDESLHFKDYNDFTKWLTDNGYEYTENEDKVNKAHDILVKSKSNDKITIKYSFIHPSEYLYFVLKNGEQVWSIDSSSSFGYKPVTEDSLKLDPVKYLKSNKAALDRKLRTAKKGKRNPRTLMYERDTMEINRLENKIKKYENWLNKLK